MVARLPAEPVAAELGLFRRRQSIPVVCRDLA
jgi:hypothetical protein